MASNTRSASGPRRLPTGEWLHAYGLTSEDKLPDWQVELLAWRDRLETGLDPVEHLRRAIGILQPESIWHPWRERRFKSLCNDEYADSIGSTILRNITWVGPGAGGKAQPLDATVWTPDGPRRMGDLKVGDMVCTPDGGSAPITGIYPQGPREVVKITLSDGSSTRCSLDHLWKVHHEDWPKPRVVDTRYLLENYEKVSGGAIRHKFSIHFTEPVQMNSRPVLIPPYMMGALLGNGCFGSLTGKGALGFSSSDPETIEHVRSQLMENYVLNHQEGTCDYRIVLARKGGHNEYISALRHYGLWALCSQDKFVPDDYLFNDAASRLELLRGLLDTDGTVDKGNPQFTSTSLKLAQNVQFLAQSLGGACRINQRQKFFTYKGEKKPGLPSYDCNIQFHDPGLLFALSRKRDKTKPRRFGAWTRAIHKMEVEGTAEMQCIMVDHPDHLYITDSFIPTHNTNDAGVFAFHYWLAAPEITCVALTTTSKQKMRQRVWPLIQECWRNAKVAMEQTGLSQPHMLNSTMELQATKGDSKHAIFGQAVESGDLGVAVERLKGVHTPRIMLIIDEAPGTPEAIFQTIPNMAKGCQELIVLAIGNGPMTHFDCFSRVCKPEGGWKSVSVETENWRTAGVPEFQLPPGVCLHFDGAKSPNVEAGKTLYPFIYTLEDWQRAARDPNIQRSAAFFSQDRGFWPPEGFLNTVLTEEMIEQGNARGQILFDGVTTPIGSVDTGFGGDACTLRFGRLGHLGDGRMAVQIDERIIIPIHVDAMDQDGRKLPAEYQIAEFIKREAEKRKVKPHCFGVEATGTGRGAAAVLTQEWGEIVWVESGGKPSDMPASEEDSRASNQVYDRKITELWFSVQAFVKGGQLGGLTEDDCQQFCARQYDYVSKKYLLEKKEDLKPRLGRSPDDADSLAILIEVARRLGMQTFGPRAGRMLAQWDLVIDRHQKIYDPENLYTPESAPNGDS